MDFMVRVGFFSVILAIVIYFAARWRDWARFKRLDAKSQSNGQ